MCVIQYMYAYVHIYNPHTRALVHPHLCMLIHVCILRPVCVCSCVFVYVHIYRYIYAYVYLYI